MLESVPDVLWFLFASWGTVGVMFLMFLLWKRGGKIGWGKSTIVVNGFTDGSTAKGPMFQVLEYVEKKVPEVQHILFGRYLRAIKDNGADPLRLTEYEDSRYVKMLLRFSISGGNGSRSVQKILENEVVSQVWRAYKNDLNGYVLREIWPQIMRTLRDQFNSEYDSVVLMPEGEYRNRWVSTAEVVDAFSEDSIKRDVCAVSESILKYAFGCLDGGGCFDNHHSP